MLDILVGNCFQILMNDLPIIKDENLTQKVRASNMYQACSGEFLAKKTNLLKVLIELVSFVDTNDDEESANFISTKLI